MLHREPDGGVHVHVLAARCDLQTGRSLNIAPPGWLNDYRPLRDMHNLEHGWANPDDPARRRDSAEPSFELKRRKAALRQGREFASDREGITALLTEAIEDGLVADRADVARHLSELGEITRQGSNHISVKPHGADRAIRLKGAIYEAEFDAEQWLSVQRADPAAPGGAGRDPGTGPEEIAGALRAARSGFRKALERRADHNLRKDTERTLSDTGSRMTAEADRKLNRLRRRIWHPWLPALLGAASLLVAQAAAVHWGWDLIRPQLEQQALNRSGLTVATDRDGGRWILFPEGTAIWNPADRTAGPDAIASRYFLIPDRS